MLFLKIGSMDTKTLRKLLGNPHQAIMNIKRVQRVHYYCDGDLLIVTPVKYNQSFTVSSQCHKSAAHQMCGMNSNSI